MKYGMELRHDSTCETCLECAKSAKVAAEFTGAVQATTYLDGCFATAFEETEESYAAVWA